MRACACERHFLAHVLKRCHLAVEGQRLLSFACVASAVVPQQARWLNKQQHVIKTSR
jgi:hypothetical protein